MADARIDTPRYLGRLVRGCAAQSPSGCGRASVQPRPAPEPPAAGDLDAAEQAALEQLGAADGYTTRWPVGRQIARSLASRQLVVIAPDYVLLTEAGRRALTGDARGRD